MKNFIKVTVFIAFVLSTFSLIIAKDSLIKAKNITYEESENNLFIGLNSNNLGLQISCAYMLGEIKSKNAIPELTAFIKNVDNDKARLTAILALLKIASEKSNIVLNQNDRNIEISQLCERLINCHLCLTEIFDPQKVKEEFSEVSE